MPSKLIARRMAFWLFASLSVYSQTSFAQQELSADEFRLTLRELSSKEAKAVPLGPSCGGEAISTLPCRAVSLTLENSGAHIVRLSGVQCRDPRISIDRAVMQESRAIPEENRWAETSWVKECPSRFAKDMPWTNTRLRPGEKTTYVTRLISPAREFLPLDPGSGNMTLRARWAFNGCIDANEADDCLTPLRSVRPGETLPQVAYLPTVALTSNTITVSVKPVTADLGPLSFSFEVSALPDGQTMPLPPNAVPVPDPHCPAGTRSAECITFHYVIHNNGPRAVRHGRDSCGADDISPEYRKETEPWSKLPPALGVCTATLYYERPIPAGGFIDGYFTLRHLAPSWNTNPIRTAGTYSFRFTFIPNVCIASPDGSFCLARSQRQPAVLSPEVTVDATTALEEPYAYP